MHHPFSISASVVCLVGLSILLPQNVAGNIAYPGIWTGRQPNGEGTAIEQVLVGTADYHFEAVETEATFYPTVRGFDGTVRYATIGRDGRYLPTNLVVGSVDPDTDGFLRGALHEHSHVIHAQCIEKEYCKWKLQQKQLAQTPTVTSGQVLNLVIPFQFANHVDNRDVIPVSDLDEYLFNGDELSVKDYFLKQSYNALEVISEVTPWVSIPYTEADCAGRTSGLTYIIHQCLDAALEEAAKTLPDWDTVLASAASVTFVHSGYSAEYGGNDPDDAWYEDRIWSHSWELDTERYQGRYAIVSDKFDRKNMHMNRVGVVVHELAQAFGAPAMHGDFPGYGLGYYDMLANPYGFDGTLTHCGSMSPYSKNLFGWMELVEITEDGTYDLVKSSTSNKVYFIQKGFPDGEYLLIENRQEEDYDFAMSQPGLAIYHIDHKANNHGGDADNLADHYVVALVQADGRFDLERMEDQGDSGDLFHAGRFTGMGPDGPFLADGSLDTSGNGHPNTNSYQGGVVKSTGIVISEVSPPDNVMSFKVTFTQ